MEICSDHYQLRKSWSDKKFMDFITSVTYEKATLAKLVRVINWWENNKWKTLHGNFTPPPPPKKKKNKLQGINLHFVSLSTFFTNEFIPKTLIGQTLHCLVIKEPVSGEVNTLRSNNYQFVIFYLCEVLLPYFL